MLNFGYLPDIIAIFVFEYRFKMFSRQLDFRK